MTSAGTCVRTCVRAGRVVSCQCTRRARRVHPCVPEEPQLETDHVASRDVTGRTRRRCTDDPGSRRAPEDRPEGARVGLRDDAAVGVQFDRPRVVGHVRDGGATCRVSGALYVAVSRLVDVLHFDDGLVGDDERVGEPHALPVLAPRPLDHLGAEDLPLALQRRAGGEVVGPLLRDADVADVAGVARRAEEVLRERVEDVDAVHDVALADGDVERHELVVVRLLDLQRQLQLADELAQALERDVLRRLLVVLLPQLVVHVEVVLRQPLLHILRRLAEVLEDDGDVHVDDDEEADDEVADEVGDAGAGAAAVLRRAVLRVRDAGEHAVPPRRRRHLEQQDHAAAERLEVEHVVDAVLVLDVHEERHAEDGEDEHDEEEQQADVDERRQRHGEREEECPNALRRLDQSQHATDAEHAHHSQQGRRHEVVLDDVRHAQT